MTQAPHVTITVTGIAPSNAEAKVAADEAATALAQSTGEIANILPTMPV